MAGFLPYIVHANLSAYAVLDEVVRESAYRVESLITRPYSQNLHRLRWAVHLGGLGKPAGTQAIDPGRGQSKVGATPKTGSAVRLQGVGTRGWPQNSNVKKRRKGGGTVVTMVIDMHCPFAQKRAALCHEFA